MRRICPARACSGLAVCLLLAGCSLFDATAVVETPAQPVAPVPVATPQAEVIAPGDTLRVAVAGEDELSGTFPVASDGTVRLELLGPVAAGGLSPAAFADRLRQRLTGGYLKDPQVSVARMVPDTSHAPPDAPRVAGALPPPALRQSETDQ